MVVIAQSKFASVLAGNTKQVHTDRGDPLEQQVIRDKIPVLHALLRFDIRLALRNLVHDVLGHNPSFRLHPDIKPRTAQPVDVRIVKSR
eukprot:332964-Hanusia_phi.AAC.3